MVDFAGGLRVAWSRLDEVSALALVPFVSSLLAISNVARVVTFEGVHLGIAFRFPAAVIDVWTFVSLPTPEGDATTSLLAIPIVVLVEAVLAAGYLGSLEEYLATGTYDFADRVGEHLAPMLGYVALYTLLGFLTVGAALAGGGAGAALIVVLGLPVFVLLSYLFYGAPYLIVIRDAGLIEALRGSYEHALAGGAYFSYGIRYLGAVALGSILGTAVVVNLGAFGVLLGALVTAPVGLALGLATLDLLDDLERG